MSPPTPRSRRAVGALAGASIVLGLLTAATMPAQPAQAVGCRATDYTPKSRVTSGSKKLVVTHLSTMSAGPRYQRTVSRSVTVSTVLRASVTLGVSVSVGVANPVLVKAEGTMKLDLAASGEHTATRNTTVTETVTNPTNHNVTMVFFQGNTVASGNWQRSYCKNGSGSSGTVAWRNGKWKSFGFTSDGYAVCGLGTKNLNALARAAYAIGCP